MGKSAGEGSGRNVLQKALKRAFNAVLIQRAAATA